jgi:capsular polysaccharide biosynthesis protein
VSRRELRGGIVHGERFIGLRRRGRTEFAQPQPFDGDAEVVAEPVVWLGWLFGHFGHFLLESLSRVWALEGRNERVLFHLPDPIGEEIWRVLKLMGVPRDRVLAPERPTLFRTLLCPSPGIELQFAAHPCFLEPFQRLAREVAGQERRSSQPLYLSRSRLQTHKRRFDGEAEVAALLEQRGYHVFHPQEHPIEEQIRVVNHHDQIVAANGSAAHLILFCLDKPKLTLLTHMPLSRDFLLCSALTGCPTKIVYCLHEAEEGSCFAMRMDREAVLKVCLSDG